MDDRGYLVHEDYSSYEEGDAPIQEKAAQMVKKDPIKKTWVNFYHKDKEGVGSKGNVGKNQSSLNAFFKK
jgi:hypothetical protein